MRNLKKLFNDSLKVIVYGGRGGPGLPQYGGIGGKGGDVVVKGTHRMKSLNSIKDHVFEAQDGRGSRRTRLVGQDGKDLIIKVPVGVTVEDLNKQILGDINKSGDTVVVAMGGRGGDKHNDNQGFVGQKRRIHLNLKLLSDAVLIGFPNAGKSTLLKALSKASPKIASYPFTTIKPNLGTIQYKDFRQITMGDLPGLVEGAHKNLGLGHEFLKHIVRTKLLVFLVDINNIDLGSSYSPRSPLETLCILNKEIEIYDDTLLDKPAILAISKMDTLKDSKDRYERFRLELKQLHESKSNLPSNLDESLLPNKLIQFDRIIPISAATGNNIDNLKQVIRDVIDDYAETKDTLKSYKELQSIENNRIV